MIHLAPFSIPPGKLCALVASVFTLGTVAFVCLAAAALVAAMYVVSLAVGTLAELSHTIATTYAHSDSPTQLLMLCILGFVLFKLFKYAVRFSPVRVSK